MSRIINFTVPEEFDGKKLNNFLRSGAEVSYSLVATLRHTDGSLLRNGAFVRTIDIVRAGDVITAAFPEGECTVERVDMELDIVYEDEDVLVLNKPPELAIHPAHAHRTDTLANGVAKYLSDSGHSGAFMAIGRLDKGTSGLVLCALSTYSASLLTGKVTKSYIAVCAAELEGNGTVDAPIIRPDPDKTLRECGESGCHAVTHYEVIKSGNGMSVVRLRLETGRTHQIRVHMAHIGAPLVGDRLYGTALDEPTHHLLHCESLEFAHPISKKKMYFTAPPPEDFRTVADKI